MKKFTAWQIFNIIFTLSIIMAAFLFSTQTSDNSDGLSLIFARKTFSHLRPLITLVKSTSETQLLLILNKYLRKCAHMFIYFLLGISIHNVFASFLKNGYIVFIFTLLSSLIAACMDEFHQLFVDGRGGQMQDVLIDMIGVAAALTVILMYKILKYLIIEKYKSDAKRDQ